MAANNCTFKKAATSMTVVGGTDVTFTETAQTIPSGIAVANAAEVDFRLRQAAEFRNRQPAQQADKTWSKAKRSFKYVEPKLLADGTYAFNVIRIELETHPETTSAELLNLRMMLGQFGSSATLQSYWETGSVR